MAKTLTSTVLLSSQALAAGSVARARLDCTAIDGGVITLAITNGASGPTAQCEARILVAHKQATMPTAASDGTADGDWKQVAAWGGTTYATNKTRGVWRIPPEVAYVEVEFAGHTGSQVTVEAHATTVVYS